MNTAVSKCSFTGTVKARKIVDIKNNEMHTVQGQRQLTVSGDESHNNRSGFAHHVVGNYELKIAGDLIMDVSGSATIKGAKVNLIERRSTRP